MSVLVDSNILMDYLNGEAPAIVFLDGLEQSGETICFSHISWMEVMIGVGHTFSVKSASVANKATALAAATIQHELFLNSLTMVPIDDLIGRTAVEVRKHARKPLPDAIIHATALLRATVLYTRNQADFPDIPRLAQGGVNLRVTAPYAI